MIRNTTGSALLTLALASLVACQMPSSQGESAQGRQPRNEGGWFSRVSSPKRVEIGAGELVTVRLAETLDSGSATDGQGVSGAVDRDVVAQGTVVIPSGTHVDGHVVAVRPAKHFGGQASLEIAWDAVETARGDRIPIQGSLTARARSTTGRDTATIAGSTVGGALLGKLIGGDGNDAVAGAVVGGGIGTAVASRRGQEAVLQAGATTAARVTETRAVRVPVT